MNSIATIVNNNKNSLSSVVITRIHPFSLHCPNSGSISRFLILLQNSNSFLASAFHMSICQAHSHTFFNAMLKNVHSFPFTYLIRYIKSSRIWCLVWRKKAQEKKSGSLCSSSDCAGIELRDPGSYISWMWDEVIGQDQSCRMSGIRAPFFPIVPLEFIFH